MKTLKKDLPNSTCLSHIEYDMENSVLRCTFADSGYTYEYQNVPRRAFNRMCNENNSAGRVFMREIRDRYMCDRIA